MEIAQQLTIKAEMHDVYDALTTPRGLDAWWTTGSEGSASAGAVYTFEFNDIRWKAEVVDVASDLFRLRFLEADDDWRGTILEFQLRCTGEHTVVGFTHRGWREPNEHFRVSAHCWARYLRLLARYVEYGEIVPYEQRLHV